MAKVIGILLIVLGVWIGMEIYTKGTQDAFGGIFASLGDPIRSEGSTSYEDSAAEPDGPGEGDERAATPHRSPVQRIGAVTQQRINDGAARGGLDAGAGETDEETGDE